MRKRELKKKSANEMKAFIKVAFMLMCLNAGRQVQGYKTVFNIGVCHYFFLKSISNDSEPVLLRLKQITLFYLNYYI